jgi:hypothetical protein
MLWIGRKKNILTHLHKLKSPEQRQLRVAFVPYLKLSCLSSLHTVCVVILVSFQNDSVLWWFSWAVQERVSLSTDNTWVEGQNNLSRGDGEYRYFLNEPADLTLRRWSQCGYVKRSTFTEPSTVPMFDGWTVKRSAEVCKHAENKRVW